MHEDLLEILCCPDCKGELALSGATRDDAGEIVTGTLTCAACDFPFRIEDGIPNLLPIAMQQRDDAA